VSLFFEQVVIDIKNDQPVPKTIVIGYEQDGSVTIYVNLIEYYFMKLCPDPPKHIPFNEPKDEAVIFRVDHCSV
jgi:hypothetical protein